MKTKGKKDDEKYNIKDDENDDEDEGNNSEEKKMIRETLNLKIIKWLEESSQKERQNHPT